MYSSLPTTIARLRAIFAYLAQFTAARAMMTPLTPGPTMATTAMTNTKNGNTLILSMTNVQTPLTVRFDEVPRIPPSVVPTTNGIDTPTTAMRMSRRPAAQVRTNTSRPS